jgi:hypothetical protein
MEKNEYEHLPYRYYHYSTTLFLKQYPNLKKLTYSYFYHYDIIITENKIGGIMTRKKKIILLFACLSLIMFIGSTAYTYAKYFSQTKRDIGTDIKKWNIKINNEDIKTGMSLTDKITTTVAGTNHIAENTIAPTSEGSFEITLDYTDVEVSFKYEITVEENEIVPDITIYKLEVDGTEIAGNGLTISNSVNIKNDPDTDKKKNIKVYLKWNDDPNQGAQLDNKADTEIVANYDTVSFNINLDVVQIQETP